MAPPKLFSPPCFFSLRRCRMDFFSPLDFRSTPTQIYSLPQTCRICCLWSPPFLEWRNFDQPFACSVSSVPVNLFLYPRRATALSSKCAEKNIPMLFPPLNFVMEKVDPFVFSQFYEIEEKPEPTPPLRKSLFVLGEPEPTKT